ncbi:MAG TPA: sigma-54 dependent transcriptional regulator [Deltaproteobacteria bacterium]|nr:sigma-54 dependent transcriptional regulator [Deltaproteobacteria bacterium]
MITYTIFVIDDELTIREGISMALDRTYQIETFATAEEALQAMEQGLPDLILLDIGLPGMNGIEALGRIRELSKDILVIMITAYEDTKTVIKAMKLGAYDYVVKPIIMDGLEVTIENALETVRLRKEVQILQQHYLQENMPCFIAESDSIQDVMEFISMVAKSPDTPVLILGETGTGKELIASAIHYRSPNFKGPFITVNCATIPKDLIESELFGYEKGAFSGASLSGKKGLIEDSCGGTLFLDEVGDLSMEAQAKLLRFLQDGEFYRLGGTKKMHIRTRIVSATNKDLQEMVKNGKFRKDLYFRLGVIKVHVPSLNDRKEDILPLAQHFLLMYADKFSKNMQSISHEAWQALLQHEWTGNVRELKNLIERGVLIGKGPALVPEDLGLQQDGSPETSEKSYSTIPREGIDLPALERNFQRHYIEEALRIAHGNESMAARLLNINHHTFRYRRKRLEDKD